MRKILAAFAFASMCAAATLNWGGYHWTVPDAADWRVNGDVLQLVTGKEPPSNLPRRPSQFAVADAGPFKRVTVEAEVMPHGRSVMIVYAYKDAAHFDYAHLSTDTAQKQTHHNGIFHVYGGERVRISNEAGPAAFAVKDRWYHVRLEWDGATGVVNVTVDGKAVPALHAVDLSLTEGKVGIGSFDETGDFRNVHIESR